ncbi:MAG: hypothetical protein WBW27_03170, partial [Pseudolabrys sp.]
YLTHLPVLGLMHGLLLGSRPDIGTPAQWAVTFAAVPVCVAVSWLLTVVIEKPLTNYGRTWAWSGRSRQAYGDIQNAGIAFRANDKLPTGSMT